MIKMKKRKDARPLFNDNVVYQHGMCCEDIFSAVQKYLADVSRQAYIERIVRKREDYTEAYFDLLQYRQYEYFVDEVCLKSRNDEISYPGYCCVCQGITKFIVDYQKAEFVDSVGKAPNWREGMVCPNCGCNSRTRLLYSKLQENAASEGSRMLICEDDNMIFFNAHQKFGQVFKLKENYPADSFDLVISNDAQVKDNRYLSLWSYFAKVLKTDGKLIMNLCFDANADMVSPDGSIWGWDIIEVLKKCGFKDAYGKVYFSGEDGHLGYLSIFFEAVK